MTIFTYLLYTQWIAFGILFLGLNIGAHLFERILKWVGIGFQIWSLGSACLTAQVFIMVVWSLMFGSLELIHAGVYFLYVAFVFGMCVAFFTYGDWLNRFK